MQNCVWLFAYFNFERNDEVAKPRSPCVLLNKNKTLKTKRNSNWIISHTILERQTLCFSSYKNRKLKVKLSWVGARERKEKEGIFVPLILSEDNFFNISNLF